ncbi:hypothetical protein EZJ49_14070 [Bdellovibrio bacteriovorus]|uniref:hypothetical protein n=1 Tax=Bdellovibrio bacteriovorus TaxID=959 RepID=UPI0021D03387|nr:hypothetical protein [Bdellovibrio bacteriovorus]UXR64189.1 hypothetical protein EZJ49_14070 [Bdellovibrio bacteriovorus]
MKSTWMKILFSTLVLSLAACSGGGGGGGGSSNSGDVANDSPTITNPPTAAKGTSTDMANLLTAVGAGTSEDIVTRLFSVFDTAPVKSHGKVKVMGGDLEPCMSMEGSDITDDDEDGFLAYYRFKSTNCEFAGEDDYENLTETYSDDLIIRDADDNNEYSNASLTLKGTSSWKNGSNAEVASGYTAASLAYTGAAGLLKMNYKTGGYNNHITPAQPQGYMAMWLSVQFSPSPLVAINANVTGFAQFYVQDVGLVTVSVNSDSDYTLNSASRCLEGGSLAFKYADDTAVVSPRSQKVCLGAFSAY